MGWRRSNETSQTMAEEDLASVSAASHFAPLAGYAESVMENDIQK